MEAKNWVCVGSVTIEMNSDIFFISSTVNIAGRQKDLADTAAWDMNGVSLIVLLYLFCHSMEIGAEGSDDNDVVGTFYIIWNKKSKYMIISLKAQWVGYNNVQMNLGCCRSVI